MSGTTNKNMQKPILGYDSVWNSYFPQSSVDNAWQFSYRNKL